jgi:phenylalanyl-tRNA synthetase beta chain
MKISFSWLKDYLDVSLPVEKVAEILTDTGLEVEGVETVESVKGGLKGVVVGEVMSCEQHPNADKLKKTTVDVGPEGLLEIVCGAPNVVKGQKVLVATVGTIIYMDNDESFKIKKSKIRGEVSEGMICAEDELGLGESHDGILALPEEAPVGVPAAEYLKITNDSVIEIGLTPNRTDAMCHIGVARDLRAGLLRQDVHSTLKFPSVESFNVGNTKHVIPVEVKKREACGQYFGLTISGLEVKESPDWLKTKLNSIGLSPVNNVVDVTNFVLHETGHPLHAFDADEIAGDKILIKTLEAGTKFVTLDEKERELHQDDLMICDAEKPLCIAGVFGGLTSGVSHKTKSIFLESAWFNPVSVRKTARRHGLNTDASFRYERGVDPEMTLYALKRAALLIQEIAGGVVSSEIEKDIAQEFVPAKVKMSYSRINSLLGQNIEKADIKEILESLEIHISNKNDDSFEVTIPTYRADVTREADVVEEILRIYGFNNIELPKRMSFSITPNNYLPSDLRSKMNHYMAARGYFEIQNNSLTKGAYYETYESFPKHNRVEILNPLSSDLNVMTQSLLFGMMEVVERNVNHKKPDLKLVEFGKNYFKAEKGFVEDEVLCLALSGNYNSESWNSKQGVSSFFNLKGDATELLSKFGVKIQQEKPHSSELMDEGIELFSQKLSIVKLGRASHKVSSQFGVSQPVYFAEINWSNFEKVHLRSKTVFQPIAKFPSVRRDLALLLNKEVKYSDLYLAGMKNSKGILKEINLFDVYEGKNLPENKKSYALGFKLQDDNKTLNDKLIEKTMARLVSIYEKEFGASLR